MIFIHLVVDSLGRAREFYESLGFRAEQQSSDDQSVFMIVDDRIVIALTAQDAFAGLLAGEVGDPSGGTRVVNALSVSSRDEVDDLIAKAKAAGATTWFDEREEPATHTGSFADPDGHVWRVTRMDTVHVID